MLQRTIHIVLSSTLLGTVILILTGITGCSLPAREPGECQVAADCSHRLQPNCEGEWNCADSACSFTCITGSDLCTSDADCGPNTFCDNTNCTDEECSGVCEEWIIPPSCGSDADCATGYICNHCASASCPVCEDCLPACVPDPKPINYCWSDADCSDAQICSPTSVTFTSHNPDGMPDLPPPKGQCIDAPGSECFNDTDCMAGQVCAFMDSLATDSPDEMGCVDTPLISGICIAAPEPGCWSDQDCTSGQTCVFTGGLPIDCADDTDCVESAALSGICIAAPDTGCWDDNDCVTGQVCLFTATGYGCSEGEDCSFPESGIGECGDAPQDGCSNDDDCPAGSICDPCGTSSCPSCPDCIPACVQVELLTAYCTGDADCSDGQECAYGSDMPIEYDAETDCGASTPDYGVCIPAADTSA